MSTLNDALKEGISEISQEIAFEAIKELKESTKILVSEIRNIYDDFFEILQKQVLNDPGAHGTGSYTPEIFRQAGLTPKPWQELSDDWLERKENYKSSLNFYHGITQALTKGTTSRRRNRRSKTRPRKALRSDVSLDSFIGSLASKGGSLVEAFFGPVRVSYSMNRPDGGKVEITTLDDAIKVIRQRRGKGLAGAGRYTDFLEGTTITVTISAFSKIENIADDRTLIGYMISQNGNAPQWLKFSNGTKPIRAVLLPLVNWYLKVRFEAELGAFSIDIS